MSALPGKANQALRRGEGKLSCMVYSEFFAEVLEAEGMKSSECAKTTANTWKLRHCINSRLSGCGMNDGAFFVCSDTGESYNQILLLN